MCLGRNRQEKYNYPQDRIHWLGSISESYYHQILSISHVHYYLTVPFVLSWSLLEALAVGLPVVASKTQPVEEVITHDQSGLLADFFNTQQQFDLLSKILDDDLLARSLSKSATSKAKKYSCQVSLDGWASVLGLA